MESGEALHEGGPATDHGYSCDRLHDEVYAHRREDRCCLVLGDEALVHKSKGEMHPPAAGKERSKERRYCDVAPKGLGEGCEKEGLSACLLLLIQYLRTMHFIFAPEKNVCHPPTHA